MEENAPKIGDLKVWHIPQVPGKAFEVSITTVRDGVLIMQLLAEYDLFQFNNKIKPDYSNAQGIVQWDGDEWVNWYDKETGEDDPETYIIEQEQEAGRELRNSSLRKEEN